MDEAIKTLLVEWQPIIASVGIRLVRAIGLFLIGRWGATQLRRVVRQVMIKTHIEASLISFASQFVYYGVLVIVALSTMSELGIQTSSAIAILGTAGIAVGLSLQGSLTNFAAGLLLIMFRPFRAGDLIQGAGVTGIVESIQLLSTLVLAADNRLVIIPNSKLINDTIINHSSKGILRVDMEVRISYKENLQSVKKVISEILDADPRILKKPSPEIGVLELAENHVRLGIRPWTKAKDHWAVYLHVHEQIIERFRIEEIALTPTSA